MKKLCLIDGSAFIFRAFHALPPLSNAQGVPVNAVYGFVKSIMAIQEQNIDYLGVIFDSSRLSFRQDMYPEYKAHRPPTPEELIPQFALIREATAMLNIEAFEQEGFEADDIIASYATLCKQQGIALEIMSSDKDLMQLIDDDANIYMYDPLKKKEIRSAEVLEKFYVLPSQVIEVQALIGDTADNVPGVRGVGPKTAGELINTYGTLEGIYANIDNITKKVLKERLIEHKDKAFLSKQLVTLKTDMVLEKNIDTFKLKAPIPEVLCEFLQRMSFNSLASKIANKKNILLQEINSGETYHSPTLTKEIIIPKEANICHVANIGELNNILPNLQKNTNIIFSYIKHNDTLLDIEILEVLENNIFTLQVSKTQGDDLFAESNKALLYSDVKCFVQQIFTFLHIKKICYNLKDFLQFFNINYVESFDDTMLMAYLIDGVSISTNLKESLQFYCEKQYLNYDFDNKVYYTDIIYNLHHIYQKQLVLQKCSYLYESVDKPLIFTLIKMQENGVLVSKDELKKLSQEFLVVAKDTEEKIFSIAGENFNLSSPKQIGEILFTKLQIKGKKNKSGSWKTGASFLEELAEEGIEIAKLLLTHRQVTKLVNTYTEPLGNKINSTTGRIHSTFLQCHVTTGRLSSIEPNLQNIPVRTKEGKRIRNAFIAKDGYSLLSLDYSQIELRILAVIASVKNLEEAFLQNADIHKATASKIFNIPLIDVTQEQRSKAKGINFGIIYGQTMYGLASALNIDKDLASIYIQEYFIKYPEIKTYMEQTINVAQEDGYVKTLWGRKCIIKDIDSSNFTLRNFAQRSAINARIQGTGADIIRKALNMSMDFIVSNNYDAKIILQIHDEILVEVKDEIAQDLSAKLTNIMESVCNNLDVMIPLKVDSNISKHWLKN